MFKPKLLVARRWPEPVEVQLAETFDVLLNHANKQRSRCN